MFITGVDISIKEPGQERDPLMAEGKRDGEALPCECGGLIVPLDAHPMQPHLGCRSCGATLTQLVKILPCRHCNRDAMSGDVPYAIGATPSKFPFSYSCSKCRGKWGGKKTVLTLEDWHKLPWLMPDEYLPLLNPKKRTA